MGLITGSRLDPAVYFRGGNAIAQGSSFDLTIGKIVDCHGQVVHGHFILKPGHMVQVVSAELFQLTDQVTGHVTYKTSLTREGIWALTVGIVDPGWDGPIATTLLNFSRVHHTIHTGDPFLRVSLFEHDPVPFDKLRTSPPSSEYLKEIQSLAASSFPPTFLNSDKIAKDAGKKVLSRIRKEGLGWLVVIAFIFTLIQVLAPPLARVAENKITNAGLTEMQTQLSRLKTRLSEMEAKLGASPLAPPKP